MASETRNIITRRLAAFALDFGLIGILSLLVARSQFEKFPADFGAATPEQLARLQELESQSLHRALESGDSLYVIPGNGFLLSILIPAVLSLIVFVLLPAATGWSPGKKLTGLQVLTTDGSEPTLAQYLIRSIVGLVDLIPGFIPGLLGFWIAGGDERGQRIGDKAAKTLVVDARNPPTMPQTDGIDLDDRLSEGESATLLTQPDVADSTPEPTPEPVTTPEPEPAEADTTEPQTLEEPHQASEESAPEIDFDLTQEPQVEWTASERDDLFAASRPPADPFPDTDEDAVEIEQRLPPPPAHRTDWEEPQATPAPVWRPEAAEIDATTQIDRNVPAAPSTPSAEDLDRRTLADQTPSHEPPNDESASDESATDGLIKMAEPTWDETWQAWLFWDAKRQRWLRHDLEHDVWVPIG